MLLLNTLHLLPRQLYPYEENYCRDVIYGLPDGVPDNTQEVEALCDEFKPESIQIVAPNAKYDEVCFACGKAIEPGHVDPSMPREELATVNPSDGNKFIAHGNYGSTVFDPLGSRDEYLQIIVCCDCLKANRERVKYVRRSRRWEEVDVFK